MSNKKFRGKYRIDSVRLKNFDYSSNGAYFITIVTKNRENFFGEIVNEEMNLSGIGEIVWNEWIKTPEIRPDMNLQMVEFVVMPNHVHGIIFIGENEYNNGRDAMLGVSIRHGDAKHGVSTGYKNKFGPQRKNLSSIIRGFKSAITKKSREILPNFAWQSRFHDRIIRNEQELNKIRQYIIDNPQMWERNRNNQRLWL